MVGQPGKVCSWDDERVTAWEHQLQSIQGRRNEGMCLICVRINEVDTVAGGQWGRGGGQERRSERNKPEAKERYLESCFKSLLCWEENE